MFALYIRMGVIEKKIWPMFFDKIANGERRYEIRLADFELTKGDTLVLKEWDPLRQRFTGRQINKVVHTIEKIDVSKFWSAEQIKKHGLYVIEIGGD
jgi:hypothetical protein